MANPAFDPDSYENSAFATAVARYITAAAAVFSVAPHPPTILATRLLPALTRAFALVGRNMVFRAARRLAVATTAFALSANTANKVLMGRKLFATVGYSVFDPLSFWLPPPAVG